MSKENVLKTPQFRRSDLNEMVNRSNSAILDLMGIIYGTNAEINITIKPSGFIQFHLKEDCDNRYCHKTHYQDNISVGYEELEIKKEGIVDGRIKD